MDVGEIKICEVTRELDPNFMKFCKAAMADANMVSVGMCIDLNILANTLETFAKSNDKLFLMAKFGDKVAGVFLAEQRLYPFTTTKIASECYFRVLPQFRGLGLFKKMVDRFELWGRESGCKLAICNVSIFSTSTASKSMRRLTELEYKPHGSDYYKELI